MACPHWEHGLSCVTVFLCVSAVSHMVVSGGNGGHAIVLGPEDWSMFIVMNEHPTNAGEAFDPVRTGLDHVGFTVPDRGTLDEWVAKFEDRGVTYSPITEHGWGWSLNFRDPDNVQLQLIAFAAA